MKLLRWFVIKTRFAITHCMSCSLLRQSLLIRSSFVRLVSIIALQPFGCTLIIIASVVDGFHLANTSLQAHSRTEQPHNTHNTEGSQGCSEDASCTLFLIIFMTSFAGDCLPLRTDIWEGKQQEVQQCGRDSCVCSFDVCVFKQDHKQLCSVCSRNWQAF